MVDLPTIDHSDRTMFTLSTETLHARYNSEMSYTDDFQFVLRLLHDRGREVTPRELMDWLSWRYTDDCHGDVLGAIVEGHGGLRKVLFKCFHVKGRV